MIRTGIIGLLQSGKTSVFKILTHSSVVTGFGSHEAHLGVAQVPDRRLEQLAQLIQPKKTTHAALEFMDVPAIRKETLREPSYLANLRQVDTLTHVVRAFGEEADPGRDIADVDLELILSDLEQTEKRLERVERDLQKMKNPELQHEREVLEKSRQHLDRQRPLRELQLDRNEKKRIRGFMFLSEKPMLIVLNASEQDTSELDKLKDRYHLDLRSQTGVTGVCGQVEAELAEFSDEEAEEAAEYLASYGLKEPGRERLIRALCDLMGLLTFFTVSEAECRAWMLHHGQTALEAAACVHTDLAARFIRAEVVDWAALSEAGGLAAARDRGLIRLEGKEYPVEEGQVLYIRHSG